MAKRIHFVGIGGAGMSAIARVLLTEGRVVSGSDIEDSAVIEQLRQLGAKVWIGHKPEHVVGADEVVLSTAIALDNPEAVEARRLGIRVRHRSEALADLLNEKLGVAVAGAHGKTTITSMLAWTLYRAGEPITFLIGGLLPGIGGARAGDGPVLIAEADESDRSFLRYHPHIAVVTSVEPDHLEYYNNSFTQLKDSYRQFLDQVKPDGIRILCWDDPTTCQFSGDFRDRGQVITYGLNDGADYKATDLRADGFRSTFRLMVNDIPGDRYELAVPGRHNVQNALACIAVARSLGVDAEAVKRELATFRGARRRFEVVAEVDGVLVVDDYAHHPSEIKATLNAARNGWADRRIIAVFQPHRYSRTSQLMDEFAESFQDADIVVLTDIYAPPPEASIPGVTGEKLAELTRLAFDGDVKFAPEIDDAVAQLHHLAAPGDIIVTMGAGSVWKIGRVFAGQPSERF